MVELTTIETLIMAYAPLIVTVSGVVIAFLKMIAIIKDLRNDTSKNNEEKAKEISDLKTKMQSVINQNYELKKKLNEFLAKIDKIKRNE